MVFIPIGSKTITLVCLLLDTWFVVIDPSVFECLRDYSLILCTKVRHHKGTKVTKKNCSKKFVNNEKGKTLNSTPLKRGNPIFVKRDGEKL